MKLDKISVTRHHSKNLIKNNSRDGEVNTSVVRPVGTGIDQRFVFLPATFRLLDIRRCPKGPGGAVDAE